MFEKINVKLPLALLCLLILATSAAAQIDNVSPPNDGIAVWTEPGYWAVDPITHAPLAGNDPMDYIASATGFSEDGQGTGEIATIVSPSEYREATASSGEATPLKDPAATTTVSLIDPPSDGKGDGKFTIADWAPKPLPDGIVDLTLKDGQIVITTRSTIPVEIPAGTKIVYLPDGTELESLGTSMTLSTATPYQLDFAPQSSGIIALEWNGYPIASVTFLA